MSSIHRALRGDVLVYRHGPTERMIDPDLLALHGRSGRTLLKAGPMRVVITALAAGGDLPAHGTSGPRTIQVLEGEVICVIRDTEYRLGAGDVMALGPGIRHAASSPKGAILLLTLVHPGRRRRRPSRASMRRAPRLEAEDTGDATAGAATVGDGKA
ncbi:MAG: hypothetical protein IPF98_04785 [Gemmatimonadetes bacterium]|nr:hypothetical protein [Gemmatimonadota bacterium]MCC6771147.1 hypothetical protein [Gemmatimonadaceae bacterium]